VTALELQSNWIGGSGPYKTSTPSTSQANTSKLAVNTLACAGLPEAPYNFDQPARGSRGASVTTSKQPAFIRFGESTLSLLAAVNSRTGPTKQGSRVFDGPAMVE
jgi:hypothetical protein